MKDDLGSTSTQVVEAEATSSDGVILPAEVENLRDTRLAFTRLNSSQELWTKFKLAFALPWRRFKSGSVLTFKLDGEISDQKKGRFAPGLSVPQLCDVLEKAALDPRIVGICVEIGPLSAGWAKVQEVRRYLDLFQQSGKFSIAYSKLMGEKEYYLATACQEIYMPPSASLRLTGFSVAGTFLRGVLEKVGVEPQVRRIGKYKSAGDQLLRKDMSDAQREQLDALLEDIYQEFIRTVSQARGKTPQEVVEMLEEGIYDMKKYKEGGWITDTRYEDEVIEDMKQRTSGKPDELRRVGIRKYSAVGRSAFGLNGRKKIAVLRTAGAIIGSSRGGASSGNLITPDDVIPKLRALAKNKAVAAVVLRVDSPGGDALASDLMWREIKKLAEKKPVIASMSDTAASGGYYLSMAANKIVAEPLTITGSIGVVTGKFNLSELYDRLGYSKTVLSRGKFAELLVDNRKFTEEEEQLFDASAQFAYESFRDKAAESRGMKVEAMQDVAQGRVWSGLRALEVGLVDALGGVSKAVEVAKEAAGLKSDEKVTVVEIGRARSSPLALLSGGANVVANGWVMLAVLQGLMRGQTIDTALTGALGLAAAVQGSRTCLMGTTGGAEISSALGSRLGLPSPGVAQYVMTDVDVGQLARGNFTSGEGEDHEFMEEEEEDPWLAGIGRWLEGW